MKGSFQGLLQAKVGQASVGTAVDRLSHYCSSADSENKKEKKKVRVKKGGGVGGEEGRVATAPTTRPLCHCCTPAPAPAATHIHRHTRSPRKAW